MQINIRTHHVEITSSIKEYVEKKLGKLDRFCDTIQQIAVDLDLLHVSAADQRQVASATVWVPGSVIRAREDERDMYAAVDLLFAKLEKQLVKHKEKLTGRSRKGEKRTLVRYKPKSDKKATKKKRYYIPKPMHPEDAAIILDQDHLDFLVFRNAENEEVNVIYVREDGDLELIEP